MESDVAKAWSYACWCCRAGAVVLVWLRAVGSNRGVACLLLTQWQLPLGNELQWGTGRNPAMTSEANLPDLLSATERQGEAEALQVTASKQAFMDRGINVFPAFRIRGRKERLCKQQHARSFV